MNRKPIRTIMWVLSVFFAVGALCGILVPQSGEWSMIFLIIPALLFNPKLSDFLRERYGYVSKWWIKTCAVLIPLILIGIVASANPPSLAQSSYATPPTNFTSSNQVISSALSESSDAVSSAVSSAQSATVSSVLSSAPPVSSKAPAKTPSKAPVLSKPVVVQAEAAPTPQSVTVYVTKTGEKYHRGNCRYLRKSKIAISLDDAKSEGYEPCSVCNPPR